MRIIAACALALMLAGCAQYNQYQQEQAQAEAANVAANDDGQCRSYGAAPGSQAYIQCRMNIDNQRAQTRAALGAALMGRMMTPPPQSQNINVNVCNVPGQVNTCSYPR